MINELINQSEIIQIHALVGCRDDGNGARWKIGFSKEIKYVVKYSKYFALLMRYHGYREKLRKYTFLSMRFGGKKGWVINYKYGHVWGKKSKCC